MGTGAPEEGTNPAVVGFFALNSFHSYKTSDVSAEACAPGASGGDEMATNKETIKPPTEKSLKDASEQLRKGQSASQSASKRRVLGGL